MDYQQMMMELQRIQEEDKKRKMIAFMLNSAMPGSVGAGMPGPVNQAYNQSVGSTSMQPMQPPPITAMLDAAARFGGQAMQPGIQGSQDELIRATVMKLLSMMQRG